MHQHLHSVQYSNRQRRMPWWFDQWMDSIASLPSFFSENWAHCKEILTNKRIQQHNLLLEISMSDNGQFQILPTVIRIVMMFKSHEIIHNHTKTQGTCRRKVLHFVFKVLQWMLPNWISVLGNQTYISTMETVHLTMFFTMHLTTFFKLAFSNCACLLENPGLWKELRIDCQSLHSLCWSRLY